MLGASVLNESFGYPAGVYADYALEVPGPGGIGTDTVPFTGRPTIPNRDYVLTLGTPGVLPLLGQSVFPLGSRRELLRVGQRQDHLAGADPGLAAHR